MVPIPAAVPTASVYLAFGESIRPPSLLGDGKKSWMPWFLELVARTANSHEYLKNSSRTALIDAVRKGGSYVKDLMRKAQNG